MVYTCLHCKKEFKDYISRPRKYCSRRCAALGLWSTEEYRQKVVAAHIKNPTNYWLGKKRFKRPEDNPFYGKKHSAASKKKMREAKLKNPTRHWAGKRRLDISEEKHYDWKGGIADEDAKIRKSPETRQWRRAVFERDSYTCQKCDVNGGKLCAHHIVGFAQSKELRSNINNGVTLCKMCHKGFHKKYGLKGFTKDNLREYLKNG